MGLSEEEKQERMAAIDKIHTDFFSSLPEDAFTEAEETLRQAIFDYLGSWTGSDLPLFHKMCESQGVREAKYACLPSGVTMKQWCERRIGAELELVVIAGGNINVKRVDS